MLVQCISAKLFLTEELYPSDDVHLAFGELTWSYGELSLSAPIYSCKSKSALKKHEVFQGGSDGETQPVG